MRADRLLALVMLLQVRGRMTAQDLAAELEVAERTIYRDIEALNAAGVPIEAERGPGGGCWLPAGYRTTLTGLTTPELQALFVAPGGGPLADLGLGGAGAAAFRKLAAALPAVQRPDVARVQERIHLDAAPWFRPAEPIPHLATIQEAVWRECQLQLTYRRGDGTPLAGRVDPYGLVSKASVWYLVGGQAGVIRAYRISRITAAVLTAQPVTRPADFDLAAYWATYVAEFEAARPRYPVVVRVAPDFMSVLPQIYGEGVRTAMAEAAPPDAAGWTTLTLTFESGDAAQTNLLGCGPGIEILTPTELRARVATAAKAIVAFYDVKRET